jgi:hypothetical protein
MGKKTNRRMACPGPDDTSVFAAFVVPSRSHNGTCARHPTCIVCAMHTPHSGGKTIPALSDREILFMIFCCGFYTVHAHPHVTISLQGQCVRKSRDIFQLARQTQVNLQYESCNLANLGPCSFNLNLHVLDAVFRKSISTSLPRSPRFVFFHG